jgi:hypothetical protein
MGSEAKSQTPRNVAAACLSPSDNALIRAIRQIYLHCAAASAGRGSDVNRHKSAARPAVFIEQYRGAGQNELSRV